MLVKEYMSTDLKIITPETKINDAIDMMKTFDIHRLPVVADNKLVGLVTEGTIHEALPSKATSLSVYEVNYLLNKTKVADIMIKNVSTISDTAILEEAIHVMRQDKIGVLPVLDDKGELQGIITNNDIFDAFLEITGYQQAGTRVAIRIDQDEKGVLAELTHLFTEHDMNIVQIVVYRYDEHPMIVTQLTTTNVGKLEKILSEKPYNIVSMTPTEKK